MQRWLDHLTLKTNYTALSEMTSNLWSWKILVIFNNSAVA